MVNTYVKLSPRASDNLPTKIKSLLAVEQL